MVLTRPNGPFTEVVGRVIGLGGDQLESIDGVVYLDGAELSEPYLPDTTITEGVEPITVPDGHVYVMGDNRRQSQDSRFLGPLPTSDVVGVAVTGQPRWHLWTLAAAGLGGVLLLAVRFGGPVSHPSGGSG